jgi:hypothetical protein
MTTTELDRLKEEVAKLTKEYDDLGSQLQEAQQALLVERFKDQPQFKRGDIILVPRKLFGEKKWWPAQILMVRLNYNEGHYPDTFKDDPGGHWENLRVSYAVRLQAKDGTFTGKNDGFGHEQVQAYPQREESE